VQEVYRKQSGRIEELEKENKRLEKEVEEVTARFKKTEDQLEDLREANVDLTELKEKLRVAEEKVAGVEELKAEIASLQRQLQTRPHRNNASISGPSESPPADLVQQLESKSAAMEAMELEISNLRAQVTEKSAFESQITALEEKLSRSEHALEQTQHELTDAKAALTRASEKAVREGVEKTSTETLIKSLQRDNEELKHEKTEAEKKIETLEKKLQAMSNLHKESEARHQAKLRESEKAEKEAASLRKKLASTENENLRLKEEQEALRKREATVSGGADDDALDELEDEERSRLQRRIRELEGEIFDLRRGAWQEKRQELQPGPEAYAPDSSYEYNPDAAAANAFDDVDLIGGSPEHSRRRSMAQKQHQQQHSSFSAVLSSGIAAFTGSSSPFYSHTHSQSPSQSHGHGSGHAPAARGSLELLSEENLEDEFDEMEFARAQAEEEARKRVEWVREIKRQLKNWTGWRLDLVDSRAGAEGAGVGMGEIFEI
jgi:myosin heavy subunit